MTSVNLDLERLRFRVVNNLVFDRDSCWRKTLVGWDPIFHAVARNFTVGRS
jgi:hypothetical protein